MAEDTRSNEQTVDTFTEALWEAIAEVRDRSPRAVNDVDSYEIVDAILPIIEARLAASEAARANLEAVIANAPHADTCSIALCEPYLHGVECTCWKSRA